MNNTRSVTALILTALQIGLAHSNAVQTNSPPPIVPFRFAADPAGDAARGPDASSSRPFRVAHQTLSLNGTWSVTPLPLVAEGESGYRWFATTNAPGFAARVPGEVHLDLMRAGQMEDPDVSDNARERCRWPEQFSWWYRTKFELPASFLKQLRQQLIFEGIDLYGQVFVNGRFVGSSTDAFEIVEFDVKGAVHEGLNELVVRVTSGTELVPAEGRGNGFSGLYAIRSFDQRRFLRKPAYAYGWDWCDPLPNIGLWRSVRLEGRSHVVLHQLRLDTVIRDRDVTLEGEVTFDNLHPWSGALCTLELELAPPKGHSLFKRLTLPVQVGHSTIPLRWPIPNPQLWWPNGMGAQPLYHLTARVFCGQDETDRQTQTLGLRTVELDRSLLPDGSRFCFKVNGHDVFCKGGNWAPADLIPARIDPARYQKFVAEARNAHFTMFRINGVGLYEDDAFYDACDRAGILLWQDCTFSCFQYPDNDSRFLGMVRHELEGVVRRLRAHPSLALWDANNECTWGMADWWGCNPNKPEEIGGVRIYHELIPDICHFYDPLRPYWPGSSSGGVDPNSETDGDCHWWDKFGNSGDMNRRIRPEVVDECRARFVSEYGIIGPPNLASVRQYLKPDELSLTNRAFQIHINSMDRGTTAAGIRYHYGPPEGLSLPDYLLYGQMFQAILQGGAMEALRFRKNDRRADCQGALVWSYNDCWGEIGWSVIDHYARRKASYYWLRRACSPIKVLVRCPENRITTRIVNDTLSGARATVGYGWIRLDGTQRDWRQKSVSIPANGMLEIASVPVPPPAERNPLEWLYAATLQGDKVPEDQAIWLLAPHRQLRMPNPRITTSLRGGSLEVRSPVYCHGVHLEDDGQEILADNYFDLLPNVPRHIPVSGTTDPALLHLAAVMPLGDR